MAGKSSVERCSVGTHLNSPCFLSRYVKENFDLHTLDDLEEEIRQTIHFRTNMKDIQNICNHHKSTFTTRLNRENNTKTKFFKFPNKKNRKETFKISKLPQRGLSLRDF
jgi:hypothetical protein